ncbi:MAG TPA: primosomal protein N' [Candidatus Paceibacterota bacterium]|nr:primosomal protein N' [Candidatus Paceibacterota bacterium]
MFLVNVIPIAYLPRSQSKSLVYFTSQKPEVYSLVFIPFGRRKIEALVLSSEEIQSKIAIKKAEFQIKPLGKIINPHAIVHEKQWKLFEWISTYYFDPLTSLLKQSLPSLNLLRQIHIEPPSLFSKNSSEDLHPQILFNDDFSLLKSFIQQALNEQKQVLFLFPNQIKLEYYWQNLSEYQDQIAIYENKNAKKFFKIYQGVNNGEIKIVFGKRSALFAPFKHLGLIVVVDEQNSGHETIETKIHYNAKEVALKLQEIWQARLVLTSLGPSVETTFRIDKGSYKPLNNPPVPLSNKISIINNSNSKDAIFADSTQANLESALNQRSKILIYNNRRGHSPALVCQTCGFIFRCPQCDTALVYHKNETKKLLCHHCGHTETAPDICPNCQSHLIQFLGIGNQKINEYFKNHFPQIKTAIFDSDHLKNLRQEKMLFDEFINNKIDILIATDLFSKFFDFVPQIDLIIIPSIEQMLVTPDYRTEERIRNLLTLFSLKSQQVLVQTLDPEKKWLPHILEKDFYQQQIEMRKKTFYPPFSQIVKLEIAHSKPAQLLKLADYTYKLLEKNLTRLFKPKDYILSRPISPIVPKINNIYFKNIYWRLIATEETNALLKRNAVLKLLPDEINIEIEPFDLF